MVVPKITIRVSEEFIRPILTPSAFLTLGDDHSTTVTLLRSIRRRLSRFSYPSETRCQGATLLDIEFGDLANEP